MEAVLEKIRDQQQDIWNKFSQGWKKWDDLTMDFLRPMGDELIRLVNPKEDDLILDVASGTGEPGLSIAKRLTGGTVVITDFSEGMLDVAREKIKSSGIKNVETLVAEVSDLPFAPDTFDSISCRFGFMFFPDMTVAVKEMVRVLKPGGRLAASVWNVPGKNLWATAALNAINKNMQITPPPPGSPGLFRCAESGLIADLFKQAGLKNVSETEIPGKLNTGTKERYWNFMTDVAAPVVAALSAADEYTKTKIKREVFETIDRIFPGNQVSLDCSALVICGEK